MVLNMTHSENNIPLGPLSLTDAQRIAEKSGEKVVPTFCGMCGPGPFGCGIYAFVKDGRFTRVAGMKESPVNRGALCPKGQAAPQWVHSPERLTHPLKRVGKKGEGKFERIGWDEAIHTIADTLTHQKDAHGPESLAILSPALRSYSELIRRFLTAHGSPNFGHSGICAMQRAFSFMYTVGDWPKAELQEADLHIYWARQPVFSAPAMDPPKTLTAAKRKGAKIVAIKPSVEPDVGMADIWMPIRPGTDAALALAMLHVVVGEDLIDKPFVEKWCYGFDKLRDHVLQYTPQWAEKITGISAEQIQEVARLYATTKRAAIDLGNGIEHAPSSSDTIRAVAILIAITGHLDRPGGNVFGGRGPAGIFSDMPMAKDITLRDRFTPELVEKLVAPEFPKTFQPFLEGLSSSYYRIFDSILTEKPYPIRTVIAPGTQPTVSNRGSKRVVEALEKLDFYVVVDVARTADMNWADIVLPVATTYEWSGIFDGRIDWLMAYRPVIEPLGDYKPTHEFFLDLGVAMGYGDDFWQGNLATAMDDMLTPFDITMEALEKRPTGIVYQTSPRTYENYETFFQRKSPRLSGEPFLPHGKVEIYNETFEAAGFSPLPRWHEPPESITGTPDLTDEFPLILSDYHTSKNFTASWLRHVPALREITPHPLLHIHPDAAAVRGIVDGDWVWVTSPHGRMKVKAELYPGIRPDTVMILHGWWQGCSELGMDDYPLLDGGANVNMMYSVDPEKAFDPLITAMSSQTLVEVGKV
jgi:anaerobic selenocysteine-containing dehydrogenase